MPKRNKVGILVGGGPAPGINSVIAAATIRAILEGHEVAGIHGGFRWIMRGDTTQVQPLKIETVSRIHFRGGSLLGAARDNPTIKTESLDHTIASLTSLGIDKLITIGGDDTAYSALTIERHAKGKIRVVHVPKTIDNDLDLPHGMNTFGYQTARHVGVDLVKNLMIDARTTGRWYLVISMGRKAGHLALGIGKAAAATVTIIPEEFEDSVVPLKRIVDVLVGTMMKRLSENRADGVAILAEGLMERLDTRDLDELNRVGQDEHGHLRLADIQFGQIIKQRVEQRLKELGLEINVTTKDIGYELRCAAPIPYDIEYTRDLGFCAAQFIINGGTGAMVSIEDGRFKPLYSSSLIDPKTKRTRVRMVDVNSEYYYIARRYMLRLQRTDFENEDLIREYAKTGGMTPQEFRKEFQYVVDDDLLTRLQSEKRKTTRSIEDVTSSL